MRQIIVICLASVVLGFFNINPSVTLADTNATATANVGEVTSTSEANATGGSATSQATGGNASSTATGGTGIGEGGNATATGGNATGGTAQVGINNSPTNLNAAQGGSVGDISNMLSPTQQTALRGGDQSTTVSLSPSQISQISDLVDLNLSPDQRNALSNTNNLSDEVNVKLSPEQTSILKSALEANQANEQTNDQNVSFEYDYPKPLPIIPGSNNYPLIQPSAWPEGDQTPLIFRAAQGLVKGLWIVPEMKEGMEVVGLPVTFTVEYSKESLYLQIMTELLNSRQTDSPYESATLAVVSTEAVDAFNTAHGEGFSAALGSANTNGFAASIQGGANRSTARENHTYRVVVVFMRPTEPEPKPVVKTAPKPAPVVTPKPKVESRKVPESWKTLNSKIVEDSAKQEMIWRERRRPFLKNPGCPPCPDCK